MVTGSVIRLQQIGFRREDVESVLSSKNGNFQEACDFLTNHAINSGLKSNSGFTWIPPIFAKVSSWMPNFLDPSTGKYHAKYVVSAGMYFWDVRTAVNRRYSEFFSFYQQLNQLIKKRFPDGRFTIPAFPDERFAGWLYGTDDKKIANRCEELDKWLRTVVAAPYIVAWEDARSCLYAFFGFDICNDEALEALENTRKAPPTVPIRASGKFAAAAITSAAVDTIAKSSQDDLAAAARRASRRYSGGPAVAEVSSSSSTMTTQRGASIKLPPPPSPTGNNPFNDDVLESSIPTMSSGNPFDDGENESSADNLADAAPSTAAMVSSIGNTRAGKSSNPFDDYDG